MVLCKSCKKKDKREYADDCFACDKGDQWEAKRHRSPNKPKTNADRIRAMTDEELCELLIKICHHPCIAKNGDCGQIECKDCWIEWLKQEYET